MKYKETPAPLGLNCIYCRSNTKARKTVFKVKCLREASEVHKEAYLHVGPLEQYQGPTAIELELI